MLRLQRFATNATILIALGLVAACGGGGGGGGGGGASSAGVDTGGATVPVKPLEVLTTNVADGAQAVDPRTAFRLSFNTAVAAAGIRSEQVQLSNGSTTLPVKIEVSGADLTVTPLANLHTRTNYQITVKAGAIGLDGSVLKNDYVLKFRTLLAMFENRQLTPADLSVAGYEFPQLRIADVNGDGRADIIELAHLNRPDLFAANGYTLNIFLQNAAGGFDKFQKLEYIADQVGYTKNFNNLIVLDLDGDNLPELLIPEYRIDDEATAGIRIYKVGADGKYASQQFIATNYTEKLEALDVDGDGRMDLVGTNRRAIDQLTGGFQVLLGTATGFRKMAPVAMAAGGYEFGVGDLDQDGKPELIVNRLFAKPGLGPLTTELLIYSQGAAGVFSLNPVLTNEAIGFCNDSEYCRDMRIVDLNGDGKPDLFFYATRSGPSPESLALAFTRPTGGVLTKKYQVGIGYDMRVLAIRDMDGDGLPDLLVGGPGYSVIGGAPNFSLEFSNVIPKAVFDPMYPSNVAIGDIDGDGNLDIVFDSYNSGIVLARHIKY